MDAQKAIQNYVEKMIQVQGMKALLLDKDTTPFVSVTYTQTQLLQKEVFLIERLENKNKSMDRDSAHYQNSSSSNPSANASLKHLKAIVFIRPSPDSIMHLCDELRNPQFSEYHLYFSNICKKSQIERCAECDEFEVVKSLNEFYGDYLALGSDLVSLGMNDWNQYRVYGDAPSQWDAVSLNRCVEGIGSLLLSLKKRPMIRFERNSLLAKRLGNELQALMNQEQQLFDFRRGETTPILLLLERRNDPVTPLVSPWTYQAMVHELLEIQNGRVSLANVPDIRAELKEVVLSAYNDQFYRKNMFMNLGDLSESIRNYVAEYQSKSHSTMNIESISDMKRFVEEYPEFRKMSGNVSMHVAIVSELSRLVNKFSLLEIGELEQSLATIDSHTNDLRILLELINGKPNIPAEVKLKCAILYALRYEKHSANSTSAVVDALIRSGVGERQIAMLQQMIKFAGSDQRLEDVFSNESFLNKGKVIFKGLKGVENVYEQHRPQLSQTLEQLMKGRLKESNYPLLDASSQSPGGGVTSAVSSNQSQATAGRTQEVIVFIIGGATYAEAKVVSQLNAAGQIKVILASNTLINSSQFLKSVSDASLRWKLESNIYAR
ncbi:hypothetical protein MP228_006279 [Amoeboaphelidium protococcarum]|nr:hypothetical protein MP228_006279 [Amoeboaphelidium protococcarum]